MKHKKSTSETITEPEPTVEESFESVSATPEPGAETPEPVAETPKPAKSSLETIENLNALMIYRTFYGAAKAIAQLRDVDPSTLRSTFLHQLPEELRESGIDLATKLPLVEVAFLATANAAAFHQGYSTAFAHMREGRNLHAELARKT